MAAMETKPNEGIEGDEIQMKEKQDLRREARRRKILENAKNRLEKLNGHATPIASTKQEMGQNINITHSCEYSDPEVEPDIKTNFLSTTNFSEDTNVSALETNILNALAGDLTNATSATTAKAKENQQRHILLTYRLHMIFCAMVALITAILWPASSNGFHIFIYSGSYVLIDLIFFRTMDRLNPLLELVVTMLGIRVQHAKIVLQIFSIVQNLVIDLSVFVFSFCSFTYILYSINNQFIDVKLN